MAFTFDSSLADSLSRIRLAVGDITTPGLFPDETYTALYVTAGNREATTIRNAAAALASYYSNQPSSLSSNGSSISWGERIRQWNLIAQGQAGGASAGIGFAVQNTRNDGYTAHTRETAL